MQDELTRDEDEQEETRLGYQTQLDPFEIEMTEGGLERLWDFTCQVLECICEAHEIKLAVGQTIDVGAYTQSLNSMLGLYRLLGIERVARPVRTLREHMDSS